MARGFQITSIEVRKRAGYILLGAFAGIGVAPLKDWIVLNLKISPIVIMVIGIIVILYFFDFE